MSDTLTAAMSPPASKIEQLIINAATDKADNMEVWQESVRTALRTMDSANGGLDAFALTDEMKVAVNLRNAQNGLPVAYAVSAGRIVTRARPVAPDENSIPEINAPPSSLAPEDEKKLQLYNTHLAFRNMKLSEHKTQMERKIQHDIAYNLARDLLRASLMPAVSSEAMQRLFPKATNPYNTATLVSIVEAISKEYTPAITDKYEALSAKLCSRMQDIGEAKHRIKEDAATQLELVAIGMQPRTPMEEWHRFLEIITDITHQVHEPLKAYYNESVKDERTYQAAMAKIVKHEEDHRSTTVQGMYQAQGMMVAKQSIVQEEDSDPELAAVYAVLRAEGVTKPSLAQITQTAQRLKPQAPAATPAAGAGKAAGKATGKAVRTDARVPNAQQGQLPCFYHTFHNGGLIAQHTNDECTRKS